MSKKKNVLIITAIVIIVALIFATVFICLNGKNHNGNDVGKVYFHKTELEHIKSSEDGTLYADDEILLVASGDAKFKDIEKLAKNNDAEIVGYIEQTGDYQLQFNKVYTVDELEEIVSVFKQNELIIDAYVNYAFVTSETKTEERNGFIYGDKWEKDLQNFNNCKGKSWGIEAIETLAAWDVLNLYKSKVNPVKVGLLDNGFDTAHEDLGFVETFYNTSAENHGTHVAGTMAAKTNNDQGICGVYPYGDGNLYGVSATGVGSYSENNESFTGIHMTSMGLKIAYAELILRNVSVINTSMGYKFKDILTSMTWEEYTESLEKYDHVLADFLQRCLKKGYDFVLVNSAGNDSDRNNNTVYDSKYNSWAAVISKEDYPEVYDRIIIVGASDSDGNICNFSNGGDRVDIYAPGDEVYSTMVNSKYGNTYKENGNEYYWSGTSMAAPHVSGVAAMVWSLNNNLTGAQVKEIVCSSHNSRYSSCDVVDAYIATQKAASTLGLSNNKNSNNGGILCWVVSASDDETKISNATVTAVNMQTNEKFTTTTDDLGHFELFVPAGKYTLTVHAEGYNDFAWPNEKEPYTNPIVVENNKVNYLNDWIKMNVEKEAVLSPESAVDIYLSNKSLWMENPQYMPMQGYGYCLLDLDFDGVLELINSVNDGSGRYSYNKFYRINLEKLTVEEFQPESDQGEGGIDYYYMSDKSKLFVNKSDGTQFYLFQNYGRVSTEEGISSYSESYMKDGKLYENYVFSEYWHPDYENNTTEQIREYTFRGEKLSKSEFEVKTQTFYETNKDLNLVWKCIFGSEFDKGDATKRKQMLLDAYRSFSYEGFSFDLVETYDIIKDNASVNFADYYYNTKNAFSKGYEPKLKLEKDGTFVLVENLAEEMGTYRGTYTISGNCLLLSVTSVDFSDFTGSDIKTIEFTIADQNTLTLNDDICLSFEGDTFSTLTS